MVPDINAHCDVSENNNEDDKRESAFEPRSGCLQTAISIHYFSFSFFIPGCQSTASRGSISSDF